MKKLISLLVVMALMAGLAVAAYAASPADYGWDTDDGDFAGWTISDEGDLTVSYNDSHNNHRVWKNLIADKENFELSIDVEAENGSRPIVKVMGIIVELNAEGGNGNQFFVKNYDGRNWNNFDWLNATACKANIRIVRENGGNLVITVTGADNAIPVVMNVAPAEDNENVELSLYSGNVSFKNITAGIQEPEAPVEPTKTPADFGWFTDGDDFAGWTAEDEANLTVSYNDSHNNHRAWKNLIADLNNFELSIDVEAENGSRPTIKVMGIIVELDSNGGNGNQYFVKNFDGSNWNTFDWLSATACKATVHILRQNGGNIVITVTGADNNTPIIMNVAPAENNENVELGLYAGNVSFKNISAATPVCAHVNVEVKDAAAATCTEAGYTGDTYCADCGEKIADGEAIPALGHKYVENECTVCGNPKTGDVFFIVVAMMAASSTALVALKKKEN